MREPKNGMRSVCCMRMIKELITAKYKNLRTNKEKLKLLAKSLSKFKVVWAKGKVFVHMQAILLWNFQEKFHLILWFKSLIKCLKKCNNLRGKLMKRMRFKASCSCWNNGKKIIETKLDNRSLWITILKI